MKTYTDYTLFQSGDFLSDVHFRNWVARPTPEMTAHWQGLLRTYPHLRGAFAEAQVLAQGLEVSWTPFSDAYTGQLLDRMLPHLTITRSSRRIGWSSYGRYAAVAAMLLLVGGLWANAYFFTGQTYQTGYAQTRTLTLYDGSTVALNANSQLRLPSRYAWRQARTVTLHGEAYFSVKKQQSKSGHRTFTVQTSRLAVEVLGTRFNLYDRPQRTMVLLDEGKIRLLERVTNRPLLMRPGQVVELTPQQPAAQPARATPEQTRQLTGWRHNLLIFDDASMTELALRFKEVYGLELVLQDDSLAGQQFRGELPVNDVNEALQILSSTFERKAIQDGSRVYFVNE